MTQGAPLGKEPATELRLVPRNRSKGDPPLRIAAFLLSVYAVVAPTPAAAAQPAADAPTYTVGIVPQQSSTELVRAWAPVLKYLSDKTGYRLIFATAKDIPTFEQRLAKGNYDFGYMSPYTYTVLHRSAPGYTAFAKEKDKKLTGIIVVRRSSPYKELRDLGGKAIAFPAASAIAATLIPRAHFDSQNIPITPIYVSSHESVYLAVAKGIHPAGGGVMRTFNIIPWPSRCARSCASCGPRRATRRTRLRRTNGYPRPRYSACAKRWWA